MSEKIIKQVVKSLNKDLEKKYKFHDYDNMENKNYFKAVSLDDEGHSYWGICIGDVGLYFQGNALDSAPDYDNDKEPFKALKQHVTAHYNAYLRELAL
jgi:hypothetical protein